MLRMLLGFMVGLLAGLGLGLVHVQTIGMTAAIAIPKPLLQFARQGGELKALLIAWDVIVVQFVGTGIPALVAAFLVARYLPFEIFWKVMGLISGALAVVLLPIAIELGPDVLLSPDIRHHLYEIMLACCSVAAAMLAYKK